MISIIRQATDADLEGICSLISEQFPRELAETICNGLSDEALKSRTTSFVAVDGAHLVGHGAVTFHNGAVANFHAFAVAHEYQHQGIGLQLVRAGSDYLHSRDFKGLAHANCVTAHLGSQKMFYTAGFSPMNTLLAKDPDFGTGQRDTAIGFALLYAKQDPSVAPLYIPKEYRAFVQHVLQPFCIPSFRDTKKTDISDRLREFLENNEPGKLYAIRPYEETAPAEMRYLFGWGYHIIGVYPLLEDGEIRTRIHMAPPPRDRLDKRKIQRIPAAQYIFNFVWEQYARGRR